MILWRCCLRTIDLFSLDTLMHSGHWVFSSHGRGIISLSKGPKDRESVAKGGGAALCFVSLLAEYTGQDLHPSSRDSSGESLNILIQRLEQVWCHFGICHVRFFCVYMNRIIM